MPTYTINGVAPGTFGIKNVNISINNQDVDVASLHFAADYIAALNSAFNEGQYVSIAVDGTRIFYGRCRAPRIVGAPGSEGQIVDVVGPWQDFQDIMWAPQVADPLTGFQYKTGRHWYGGASLTTTISVTLQAAILDGAQCQLGTIDLPAINIPRADVVDVSIASIVQSALRWLPGAIVYFDYSVTPPRVHCLKADSTLLTTISAPGDSAEYKPRSDLVPSGIRIAYERRLINSVLTVNNYNVTGAPPPPSGFPTTVKQGIQRTTNEQTLFVAQDSAGQSAGPRVMQFSVLLRGAKRRIPIFCRFPTGYMTNDMLFSYNASGIGWENVAACARYAGHPMFKRPAGGTSYDTVFDTEKWFVQQWSADVRIRGTNTQSMWTTSKTHTQLLNERGWSPTDSFPPDELLDNPPAGWTFFDVSIRAGCATGPQDAYPRWFTFRSTWAQYNGTHLGAGGAPYRDALQTIDATTDEMEQPPSGLAAGIFSALSADYYEGSVLATIGDAAPAKRIVLIGGRKSPVQSVSMDLATGKANFSFGPPQQLRPSEFLELFNPLV